VPTRLNQHGQGHAYGSNKGEIVEPLNVFTHKFSSFLSRREELIYGHLGIILMKSRKESSFQVNPRVDGAVGKTPEPIKGYTLKGADE